MPAPGRFIRLCSIVAVIAATFQALGATAQQPERSAAELAIADLATYYYKDPRPERLIGYLEKYEQLPAAKNWAAYPPLAGFYAVILRAHPGQVQRLIPSRLDSRLAPAMAAAAQLSGNAAVATALQSRIASAAHDEKLKTEFAGLPARLEDIRIRNGTHLDILWSAFFASGDSRYTSMIIDFFAETANRSEATALDVMTFAAAVSNQKWDGVAKLRPKYNDAGFLEVMWAGTALWGIASNGKQHPPVAQTVSQYIKANPGTTATKVLSALQPRPGRT